MKRSKSKANLSRIRVQYDSLRLKAVEPAKSENPPIEREQRVSVQALVGLLIATVGAYIVGLSIGAASSSVSVITDTPVETRDTAIGQVLASHPVDSLIGEFWRILPAGQASTGTKLVPVTGCARSAVPAASFATHSFAYFLSTDSTNPALSQCSIGQLSAVYGRASSVTIISGSIERPTEQLVFYDHGAQTVASQSSAGNPPQILTGSAVLNLGSLPNASCPGHETIMQIVAHEDDDLLFMNPDLLHALQAGDCVRTVYLTAGDAGSSKFYWLNRERGSEAAYAYMAGFSDAWNDQTVKLGSGQFAGIATPTTSSQVSLLFLHLPDGKPDGQGFVNTDFESLAKLLSGQKTTIQSVDGQSKYKKSNLISVLTALMDTYKPIEVRSQLPYNHSTVYSDHSDHIATGQLATQAFKSYQPKHASSKLAYYTGYPIREQPTDVDGDDLAVKEQAFFIYAQYDGQVCDSVDMCIAAGDYGDYLQRQYRTDP